jgi:uncharacterized protein GlcG (DUF336 family)
MALTRARARESVERGLAKAQALGFKVAIAVVDDAGHLIVCDRMDGALWVTPEIARAKANAAAAFHATTLDLEERFTRRQLFADNVAMLGDYRFVFGKGARPSGRRRPDRGRCGRERRRPRRQRPHDRR